MLLILLGTYFSSFENTLVLKISLYFCGGERRSWEMENERIMEEVVG